MFIEEVGPDVESTTVDDTGTLAPASPKAEEVAEDSASEIAEAVAEGHFDHGILICSTGIGMSMVANKTRGIRAALCHDTFSARRAREHTNANILCMGEWAIGQGSAREIVKTYLTSEFVGGRHARRLEKMRAIEDRNLA